MSEARALRKMRERFLATENARWPAALAPVPREQWPPSMSAGPDAPIAVLRSMTFLVQVFDATSGLRLSVNRTVVSGWEAGQPKWLEGISWDEMQRLKAEAGYADRWAVEIFPPSADVVNVANMRHLWLLPEAPSYGWRRGGPC